MVVCPLWLCVAGALQFVLGLNGLALCGFGIFFFLGCNNRRIAGATLPYFNRPVTPFLLTTLPCINTSVTPVSLPHPTLHQHVSHTCLPSPARPASICQWHLSPFPTPPYISMSVTPVSLPHPPLHQHVSDTCLPSPVNISMSVTPVSLPQSTSVCQWHPSPFPSQHQYVSDTRLPSPVNINMSVTQHVSDTCLPSHPALHQYVSDTFLPYPPTSVCQWHLSPQSSLVCRWHLSPFPTQHQYVSDTCLPYSSSVGQWHLSPFPIFISMSVTPVSLPNLH